MLPGAAGDMDSSNTQNAHNGGLLRSYLRSGRVLHRNRRLQTGEPLVPRNLRLEVPEKCPQG
jgi:hypothetical protein